MNTPILLNDFTVFTHNLPRRRRACTSTHHKRYTEASRCVGSAQRSRNSCRLANKKKIIQTRKCALRCGNAFISLPPISDYFHFIDFAFWFDCQGTMISEICSCQLLDSSGNTKDVHFKGTPNRFCLIYGTCGMYFLEEQNKVNQVTNQLESRSPLTDENLADQQVATDKPHST